MLIITGESFAEVYYKILDNIYNNYEFEISPRNEKVREISNLITVIKNPRSNLFINIARPYPYKYLAGELYWYFTGQNKIEFINKYSSFWKHLVNPDGETVNSAYGNLLFCEQTPMGTEWQWALNALKNDKDTRQAIIRFNKPQHSFIGNKDFVCTLNGIFNIRNNKLNFTIIMRSQDEIFGRTFDVPFFTILQQQMLNHLLPKYPTLKLGEFVQHNISSHIYERNYQLVEKMLSNKFEESYLPRVQENLIDENCKFNPNFMKSVDELITWIKNNM